MQKTINTNWKFIHDDHPGIWRKDYDDAGWRQVTLPHDWSVEAGFSKDHSSGTGYLQGGTGWYRGRFKLPESCKGKKIWLVFDGVYKNSQVWCNSSYLGKRPNGYISFQYDISHCASFGEDENVISVKVTHEDIADSRWFTGSGIYRKVSVIVQEQVYFDRHGIVFHAEPFDGQAKISIKNTLVNESTKVQTIDVENVLFEGGIAALSLKTTVVLQPGEHKMVENSGNLPDAKLWSDDTPFLYTLNSCMMVNGNAQNSQSQRVGIREIIFNADAGFFVNGVNKKLKGVCVHHDAGCLGAAVTKTVWQRRLEKLKAVGCNAIRMSHNPHMPELFDLCDEMGFYVIDEAFDEWEGCKNKWAEGHNVYPPRHEGYFEDFPQWHDPDLRELIRRDRNHPSILMWSIGNEIDYPNDPYCHPMFETMTGNNDKDKPTAERMYNPNKPNMERLTTICKKLTEIVKEEDDTRAVTAAVAFPELSTYLGYIDSLDVVGYNYKEQLYVQDHKRFPDKPFLGSENGHEMENWKAVRDQDFISGQFLWTGYDFLGEAQGWPIRGSQAGLLTTAGFEKARYWFRQALWADRPVAKLVTARKCAAYLRDDPFQRNWSYGKKEEVCVRCFTNCKTGAELFINGKSQGHRPYDDETGYIQWTVVFEEGTLTVKTADTEDVLETSGRAAGISLALYPAPVTANGEDVAQVEVSLVDSCGRDTLEDDMLFVSVTGGTLQGIESGDLSDLTEYGAGYRRTFRGKMIIYVRAGSTGEITLRISGDVAGETVIKIPAVPAE